MGARFLKNLPFEPTFFLLLIYLIFTMGYVFVLNFFLVFFIHEIAHVFVANKLGYTIKNFSLAPHGASIDFSQKIFMNNDELMISIAGPFSNLFCALFFTSLWWIFPNIYNISYLFVFQSYAFGLFNLLPCYPLDGGRILTSILQNYISRNKAIKFSCYLNILISSFFFLSFVISCFVDFNLTLLTVSLFLLSSCFLNNSNSKFCLIDKLNKSNKNFSKVKFVYIKKTTLLSKIVNKVDQNKFTIFVIDDEKIIFIDEQKIFTLTYKFPITMSIGEILDQIRHK